MRIRNYLTLTIPCWLQVVELEPDNKAAQNQIALCDYEIKSQEKREKQLYSKMFDKYSETTEV